VPDYLGIMIPFLGLTSPNLAAAVYLLKNISEGVIPLSNELVHMTG